MCKFLSAIYSCTSFFFFFCSKFNLFKMATLFYVPFHPGITWPQSKRQYFINTSHTKVVAFLPDIDNNKFFVEFNYIFRCHISSVIFSKMINKLITAVFKTHKIVMTKEVSLFWHLCRHIRWVCFSVIRLSPWESTPSLLHSYLLGSAPGSPPLDYLDVDT